MRSMSVPDQANIKTPREKPEKSHQKNLRAVSERHLPATSSGPTRERARSKDSEKENIPASNLNSMDSSSTNSPTESSSTVTYSSSGNPAKSMALTDALSADKSLKDSLDLDIENVSIVSINVIF